MDLKECSRCKILYTWTKSTSSLKMTYCTSLCEIGDLGFSLEALEKNHFVFVPKKTEEQENQEEKELITV